MPPNRHWILPIVLALPVVASGPDRDGSRVLFETGFEAFEGYVADRDLVGPDGRGQNGWTSVGTGGNGVLADPVAEFEGRYAYIGFQPPASGDGFLNLFRPVRFVPAAGTAAVAAFQVRMSLRNPSDPDGPADDFRWSVYTTDDRRLFSIDFHGGDRGIHFALDDTSGFTPTGYSFGYGESYLLDVVMSFGRNRWSAWINDTPVVWEQPITTRDGPAPDLGSVDAVWAAGSPGRWDDNYMMFDDYRILALAPASLPAQLEVAAVDSAGRARIRVWGEPGVRYRIQSSGDLANWSDRAVVQATSPDGLAEFPDPEAFPGQSYRAVSIP